MALNIETCLTRCWKLDLSKHKLFTTKIDQGLFLIYSDIYRRIIYTYMYIPKMKQILDERQKVRGLNNITN